MSQSITDSIVNGRGSNKLPIEPLITNGVFNCMTLTRFRKRVESLIPTSECIRYGKTVRPYPIIKIGGKHIRANRLSFLLFRGKIPDGMLVCHSCDVTNCVNPDHLFIGTVHHNNEDRESKGRTARDKRLPQTVIPVETIRKARHLRACGFSEPKISFATGLSRSYVHHVLTYKKARTDAR